MDDGKQRPHLDTPPGLARYPSTSMRRNASRFAGERALMIVSDNNVSKALEYLAVDPHPVALARKDLTDAENFREALGAQLYLSATGPVKERECTVECAVDF